MWKNVAVFQENHVRKRNCGIWVLVGWFSCLYPRGEENGLAVSGRPRYPQHRGFVVSGKCQMPYTTFLLGMTKEQRGLGSGKRREVGRARPCRAWKTMLADLAFILKPKENRGMTYLSLCVKDSRGSEISSYLQAYRLICHSWVDADRRKTGQSWVRTKGFINCRKSSTWSIIFALDLQVLYVPWGQWGMPANAEGRDTGGEPWVWEI